MSRRNQLPPINPPSQVAGTPIHPGEIPIEPEKPEAKSVKAKKVSRPVQISNPHIRKVPNIVGWGYPKSDK